MDAKQQALHYFSDLNSKPDAINLDAWLGQQRQQFMPKPKTRGRGGFLSSLISEAGGATGAAGGAALGTAILPGVGTLIGAGLGGFLGGAGGRVAENKVRDDRIGLGDALKEGALSGALSLGGEAFQLARGARTASKLAEAGIESNAARAAVKPGGNMLENVGKSIKAGSGGYGIGTRLGGEDIGAQGSQRIAATLKQLKIPATSPEKSVQLLEPRLSAIGETLSQNVAKNNVKLTPAQIKAFGQELATKVSAEPGLGGAASKYAQEQTAKLTNVKDLQGLLEFRRGLDKMINFNGTSSVLAEKQGAARIMREGIRDKLNGLVPGLSQQNNLYHDATDALTLLKKGAKDMKGGGVVGKVTNLSPVKAGEAKLGSALEATGKGLSNPVVKNAIRQLPGDVFPAATAPGVEEVKSANPYDQQFGAAASAPSQDLLADSPLNTPQQQQSQSPYSLQQALMDIQRDPKNTDKYLSIYKTVESATSPTTASGHGKATAQQYALATAGSQGISQLANLLSQDPGVLNRAATPGQNLPGVGGFVQNATGTGQYQAVASNVLDALARARTGAAMTKSEEAFYHRLLPRAGDSETTIRQKLYDLQQAFGTFLEGGGDSSANLGSAMGQY